MKTQNQHSDTPDAPTCLKPLLGDVFKLFLSTDQLRPVMCSPFRKNDKVYATDAYTIIFINESDLDFDFINDYQEQAPNVDQVIPKENTSKIIDLTNIDFSVYKTEKELVASDQSNECKTCDGTGEVEWEFEMHSKDDDCPVCDGKGYIGKEVFVETGAFGFGEQTVKLNDACFKIKNFYKLSEVQKLDPNSKIELVFSGQANQPHLFKIGICSVLIQPCMFSDSEIPSFVLNIA